MMAVASTSISSTYSTVVPDASAVLDQPIIGACVIVSPSSSPRSLNLVFVVATLSTGVLEAAYVSDPVGSFVEESGEHWFSAAAETFTADEELSQADRVLAVVGDPALGGEVSEFEGASGHADAAGGKGHHDIRHVRVLGLDGGSSVLERCDQRAGVQCGVDS